MSGADSVVNFWCCLCIDQYRARKKNRFPQVKREGRSLRVDAFYFEADPEPASFLSLGHACRAPLTSSRPAKEIRASQESSLPASGPAPYDQLGSKLSLCKSSLAEIQGLEELYDPLDTVNLAASIACELFRREERSLTQVDIKGISDSGGIYAIFYRGAVKPYRLYKHLNSSAGILPIYVGKAAESATVNGLQDFRSGPGSNSVKKRLQTHKRKIDSFSTGAIPVQTSDFSFRFLGLPDAHVSMAEAGLITFLSPIWNGAGFGSNAPGGGRPGKLPPNWLGLAHGPSAPGLSQSQEDDIRFKILEQARKVLRKQNDPRLERARSAILVAARA